MDGDLSYEWECYCNPRDLDAELEAAEDYYDCHEDEYR